MKDFLTWFLEVLFFLFFNVIIYRIKDFFCQFIDVNILGDCQQPNASKSADCVCQKFKDCDECFGNKLCTWKDQACTAKLQSKNKKGCENECERKLSNDWIFFQFHASILMMIYSLLPRDKRMQIFRWSEKSEKMWKRHF